MANLTNVAAAEASTTATAPDPVAAVIADVESALAAALEPSADSNATGVAMMVRAALDQHR